MDLKLFRKEEALCLITNWRSSQQKILQKLGKLMINLSVITLIDKIII